MLLPVGRLQSAKQLARLAILGNSFTAYADALTAAQRDRAAGWCRRISPHISLYLRGRLVPPHSARPRPRPRPRARVTRSVTLALRLTLSLAPSRCRLMRAAPFATEADCGEAAGARSEFANAFNNLCLHTFAPPALPAAAHPCWALPFDAPPAEDPLVSRDIILAVAEAQVEATAQGGGSAACVDGCCA